MVADVDPIPEDNYLRDNNRNIIAIVTPMATANGVHVEWVINAAGMLTHKWDIADFFTGGGGDVGYIEKKLKSTGNPDRGTGVTPMLDGSMLSLTVADTMAYGNRAVKIRVVDTKISDSFVTHDGEYFEDEYEDEFMFNVTARRNIAPELGEDKDLGTTVTGTKKAVAVPIKKANRVARMLTRLPISSTTKTTR